MIVTLLTDFGLADHYVAAMKGIILSYDPRIQIVDISHEVPVYDRAQAAFLLASCHSAFPPGTVHLVVVDPGVGSPRRPLALKAQGSFFVGPDNGIFPFVVSGAPDVRVIEIDPGTVRESQPSTTFHGRDVFAPAAAALATGRPLDTLGQPIEKMVALEEPASVELPGGILEGQVLHVDRFGNCITSLRPTDFPDEEWTAYTIQAGGLVVDTKARYYDEAEDDRTFIILGSTGYLELAIKQGAAAERLGLGRGDRVRAFPAATTRAGATDSLP